MDEYRVERSYPGRLSNPKGDRDLVRLFSPFPMSNASVRHDNAPLGPLLLPRQGHAKDSFRHDIPGTASTQYAYPQDPRFSSSRLPSRTRPVLTFRHDMNDNYSTFSLPLNSHSNLRGPTQYPGDFYHDRESCRVNVQHVRSFPAPTAPIATNCLHTHPISQHIYSPPAAAPIYGLPAKTHTHTPYRSSPLNPNNPANSLSSCYPPSARLSSPPPPLYFSRPSFAGYPNAHTISESVRAPLASISSLSLPSNDRLVTQPLSPTLQGVPFSGVTNSNLDYHPEYRSNHVQQYTNQENVDPATRKHTPQEAQKPRSKIEVPVPVRYHDIAVQSLKTHAASMNNDVGFLGLLNSNRLGDSAARGNEMAEVAPVSSTGSRLTESWVPEPTPLETTSNDTFTGQGKGRRETKTTPTIQHAADQVEDEIESVTSNTTLTNRINSYGRLKLVSPDTLIALTEPVLLDWCFDHRTIERLAAMPTL